MEHVHEQPVRLESRTGDVDGELELAVPAGTVARQERAGDLVVPFVNAVPEGGFAALGATHSELGLVGIMADYGYLRAYDALVPWLLFPDSDDAGHRARRRTMTAELTASTDKIVGLRVAAWELEHVLNGLRATPFGPTSHIGGGPLVAVPDAGAISEIRNRKSDIHDALVARLDIPVRWLANARPGQNQTSLGVLPVPRPRAEAWYLAWESHSHQRVVAPDPGHAGRRPVGQPHVRLGVDGSPGHAAAVTPMAVTRGSACPGGGFADPDGAAERG